MNLRNAIAPVLLGAACGIGVAACGPSHAHHVSAASSAQAKADAKALAKCLPKGAVAQIKLAKSLETKSGRAALVAQCGIAPANKQRFEAEVLQAAEGGHLTTKAGRTTFFEVTLPAIVERNQG